MYPEFVLMAYFFGGYIGGLATAIVIGLGLTTKQQRTEGTWEDTAQNHKGETSKKRPSERT